MPKRGIFQLRGISRLAWGGFGAGEISGSTRIKALAPGEAASLRSGAPLGLVHLAELKLLPEVSLI
jgi:hypothetical protein